MTPQQVEQLVAFFVINLPFVTVIVLGQRRGWWVDGRAHDREIAEKDKFIVFITDLWKKSLTDLSSVEERSLKQSEAMRELTGVVRESLGFQRQLVEEARQRDWEWDRSLDGRNRQDRQRPLRISSPDGEDLKAGG